MRRACTFRNVDDALPILSRTLLAGAEIPSRAGVTREQTFVGIEITNPTEREPLHPYRRANIAALIFETMWVLSGRDDVETLSHYLPRAKDFSDDGQTWRAAYGPRLRYFGSAHADQVAYVINALRKDPGTRQAVISILDPDEDLPAAEAGTKDFPCNNWLHFLARDGVLSLHVSTRSNDLIWGWSGINQFEWSVLLQLVAECTGLAVGPIHYSITSLHLYERHFEKAQRISDLNIEPVARPGSPLIFAENDGDKTLGEFDRLAGHFFEQEFEIRNGRPWTVEGIESPLLRSWLRILDWYWNGHENALSGRERDIVAASLAPKRAPKSALAAEIVALHDAKSAAYGDSWCRRGELMSILPNIARKVDRLGAGETDDENQRDTAIDLFVYLVKYLQWLGMDKNRTVNQVITDVITLTESRTNRNAAIESLEAKIKEKAEDLFICAESLAKGSRGPDVRLNKAMTLASLAADLVVARNEAGGDDYRGADAD